MREHRACLDSLGPTTRRLLGLRAGLDGAPLSRGETASRLGISSRREARLERNGLRTLQVTCGGGGGSTRSAPPRVVRLANAAPALQPASFLPASSAPQLEPAVQLAKPRGRNGVGGTSSTSTPPSGGSAGGGPLSAAATSAPLDSTGPGPGLAILMAACLATLAGLLLFALRRRAVRPQRPEPVAAAAPAPSPEPVATYVPPPSPPEPVEPAQPTTPVRTSSRATRAATVAATSAIGLALRELIRRRRR